MIMTVMLREVVLVATMVACEAFSPSIHAGGLHRALPNIAREAGRPLTSRCFPLVLYARQLHFVPHKTGLCLCRLQVL